MYSKKHLSPPKRFVVFSEWSQKIYNKKFLLLETSFHSLIKKRPIQFLKKKKKKLKVESVFLYLSNSSIRFKKNITKTIAINIFPRFLYYLQDLSLSINFIIFFSFFVLHINSFFVFLKN